MFWIGNAKSVAKQPCNGRSRKWRRRSLLCKTLDLFKRQEVLSLYFQWVFVSVTAEDHLAAENWSLWHLSIWQNTTLDGWKLHSNSCIPHSFERTKGVQLGRSCSILSGPLIAVQMILQYVLARRMFLQFLWITYLKSNSLSCYGHMQNIDPKPLATGQTAAISFFPLQLFWQPQWQQG